MTSASLQLFVIPPRGAVGETRPHRLPRFAENAALRVRRVTNA